jgi:integrase/recombinase XerC
VGTPCLTGAARAASLASRRRDGATKGEKGGRLVPLCAELRAALQALKGDDTPAADARIIHSERDLGLSAGAITVWFYRLYNRLGLKGASSHSGRRTFVTELAKTIVAHGGSLRDVQQLAGHASLPWSVAPFGAH